MKLAQLQKTVTIPEGVQVEAGEKMLKVKGPKGELTKHFASGDIMFSVEGDTLTVKAVNVTRVKKMFLGTYTAHARNLLKGVSEGFTYQLRVCASHFPMTVTIDKGTLVVKNFLGEAVPRKLVLKQGADVKIDGNEIYITSIDKELAGTIASDIEQLMRRPGFDRRVFQDGIYIVKKGDKEITV
ncbi:MAG: 50S ribosomal protein L6 [Candidatus Woesearchaeota archaeon]